METSELRTTGLERLGESGHERWVSGPDAWHAAGLEATTRCGLDLDEPTTHYRLVLDEHDFSVTVCRACLDELEAEASPTAGELFVEQFRLYYVE